MENKTLIFLNYDTGEILEGIQKLTYRKNGSQVKSRITFEIKKHETISEIVFSNYHEEIIDITFELKKNQKENGTLIVGHHVLWGTGKYKNGDTGFKEVPFLCFSILEKAKEVNIKFVLPKLIGEQRYKVQNMQEEFTKEMDKLMSLESKLKMK